jgi:hypothetical protein
LVKESGKGGIYRHAGGVIMQEKFTHNGIEFVATIKSDDSHGAPWEECDGHGIVSDWTKRAKLPGELVLCENRGMRRFYDFAATVKIARRDGWDSAPYGQGKKGERAARAVLADFEYLRRYCAGDWGYVVVTVRRADACECCGNSLSVGGVESGDDYWLEVAQELAGELI